MTDTGENETFLEQSCGNSCPEDPVAVKGALLGATYKGPFGKGKDSYVVLQLPAPGKAPQRAAESLNPEAVYGLSRLATLPAALRQKTVQYRFETVSWSSPSSRPIEYTHNGKMRFFGVDDVFVFSPRVQAGQFKDEGFIYKYNLEVDFVAHPNRAPKDFSFSGKSYTGLITFSDGVLIRTDRFVHVIGKNERGGILETKIRFSQDFTSCSVVAYHASSSSGNETKLMRSIECTIK